MSNKFKIIIFKRFLLNILIFSVHVVVMHGQELVTDRPDQTESAVTIPKGSYQLEFGLLYEVDNPPDSRIESLTPVTALFRLGAFEKFEFRIKAEYYRDLITENRSGAEEYTYTEKGLNPLSFGVKLQLLEQLGFIPDLSIIGHVSFPRLATEAIAPDKVHPDFTLAASHSLSDRLTTGYNLGVFWDGNFEVPFYFYSVVLGVNHSEKFSSFYEFYGYIPPFAAGDDLRIDAGITYLLDSNFQLDLAAGIGITGDAPDYFGGIGFSWRLPE